MEREQREEDWNFFGVFRSYFTSDCVQNVIHIASGDDFQCSTVYLDAFITMMDVRRDKSRVVQREG